MFCDCGSSRTTIFFFEQVQSPKYMGITISENLGWGQHVSGISLFVFEVYGLVNTVQVMSSRTIDRQLYSYFYLDMLSPLGP